VKSKVDAGYQVLAKSFGGELRSSPLQPRKDGSSEQAGRGLGQAARSVPGWICVEHANAAHTLRLSLQRDLGQREDVEQPIGRPSDWCPTARSQ
jgi:hypothetical protein